MKILGIDTSTEYLSLAIVDGNKILSKFHQRQDRQHSSLLIPTIDKLLKSCSLRLKDINGIALSIGPGSFTGLRIGVATCKGINIALGMPIIAIPTLDVIAYNFINEREEILCPVIDGKKEKVYTCFYRNLLTNWGGSEGVERVTDYMLIDIDGLLKRIDKPILIFGDAVKLYSDYCKRNLFVSISAKDWFPKAEVVAKLGLSKAMKRQFANPDKLVPMYLHSKYCQVSGRGQVFQ